MRKTQPRRRAPARPAKRASSSTALVRRSELKTIDRQLAALAQRTELLPAGGREGAINEGMALGALGLVELKLTAKEEQVLNERVDPARVLWRPRKRGGPADIPYLPHQDYTRWFNRAFGRTGWALVPVGKPALTPGRQGQQTITCPYILHIHGKPVAFAMGEQEYFESNEQQTYGDALESTVASALRRCAKRLGVGLELWDKNFLRSLPRPPASDHVAAEPELVAEHQHYQAPRPDAPVAHHAASGEAITDKQRKRLWTIIRNSGRTEESVRAWLQARFGWTSTKQVTRREYDFVCKAIESPVALP
jgi:hypothetical protein